MKHPSWLFIGIYPNATMYADKRKQAAGDYYNIASVYYNPPHLKVFDHSPKYSDVVRMAQQEVDERNGIFTEYVESTHDKEQSHVLKYKNYFALRLPSSHTQGVLKIFKDGKLIQTFELQDGYETHHDGRDNPYFITDKTTRQLIDDIDSGKLSPTIMNQARRFEKGGSDKINWDKWTYFVSQPDYTGTIKRNKKGWMLYDADGHKEEAGPFNSLETLMDYYEIKESEIKRKIPFAHGGTIASVITNIKNWLQSPL